MIAYLFAFLGIFLLVIGVHELGHALAAWWFGVRIQTISLGLGKPIFRIHQWSLGRWPLGGFVRLLNTRIDPVLAVDYPYCFDKKPILSRILILLAGAGMNFLFAYLLFLMLFMHGYQETKPMVLKVIPNSIAQKNGVTPGASLIEINHQVIHSWQEAGMVFLTQAGNEMVILFKGTAIQSVKLNQKQSIFSNSFFTQLGIIPDLTHRTPILGASFEEAAQQAGAKFLYLCSFFMTLIKQILLGHVSFSVLLGPFSFSQLSKEAIQLGMSAILSLLASLNLVVGLVNLLPIPGLDGGLIVYACIEKIRKKTISIALEVLLHRFTCIILFLILFQLLMNDMARFLRQSLS